MNQHHATAESIDPKWDILGDCRRLMTRTRTALSTDDLSHAHRERLLKDIHAIKGAAGFLNRTSLARRLHDLEQALLPASETPTEEARGVIRAVEQLLMGASGGQTMTEVPFARRFGESLWWTQELMQSLAGRMGKQVFVVVHGGDQPVSQPVFEVLKASLVHLARNAIFHGIEPVETRRRLGKPPAGLIQIKARRHRQALKVTLSDNGAGLEKDDLDRIFRFGESNASTRELAAGRGIGLSAVRELVEEQGGHVRASAIAGEGAQFTLVFPDN